MATAEEIKELLLYRDKLIKLHDEEEKALSALIIKLGESHSGYHATEEARK